MIDWSNPNLKLKKNKKRLGLCVDLEFYYEYFFIFYYWLSQKHALEWDCLKSIIIFAFVFSDNDKKKALK